MNSNQPKEDKLREVLVSHFDDEALKKSSNDDLKIYGSRDNDEYLRAPYEFVEEELLNNISGLRVLDYCCGTGIYSIYPALKNANGFGIDISDQSIKVAEERAELFGVSKNCNFSVGDAEDLDFDDEYFDIILSYGSLSYLNLRQSFKELRRVLKPRGKLIIVDSLGHNPILNFNRRRNIRNYASEFVDNLRTITHEDLKISEEFFQNSEIKYFDFTTLIGNILSNKYRYNSDPSILMKLDSYILRLPLLNKLSFKFVCVIN